MNSTNGNLWFRAEVSEEVAERLSETWGVERDGRYLMCTASGLFNLKAELRGSSLFVGDGGAVLSRPGHKMIMFQENKGR
ncbi:hypothetical protein [Nocardiopsis metallicus]|uniref:Uncharacterized protein n=1 Tax=Nocardiopsis metallicus TaxID=179819 RepID=A0A840VZ13_9ACTN|nr:hypothetical protein [Nocardiopsis metallicus]MBB5489052.1 hypothetical protein [Nocardiopsis metallicus]